MKEIKEMPLVENKKSSVGVYALGVVLSVTTLLLNSSFASEAKRHNEPRGDKLDLIAEKVSRTATTLVNIARQEAHYPRSHYAWQALNSFEKLEQKARDLKWKVDFSNSCPHQTKFEKDQVVMAKNNTNPFREFVSRRYDGHEALMKMDRLMNKLQMVYNQGPSRPNRPMFEMKRIARDLTQDAQAIVYRLKEIRQRQGGGYGYGRGGHNRDVSRFLIRTAKELVNETEQLERVMRRGQDNYEINLELDDVEWALEDVQMELRYAGHFPGLQKKVRKMEQDTRELSRLLERRSRGGRRGHGGYLQPGHDGTYAGPYRVEVSGRSPHM